MHTTMRRAFLLSFLFSTCLVAQDGFKPLFNSKDLTGGDKRNTMFKK